MAENAPTEYRCPGEPYPISRAVHLGRLAAYYPGCRQCPHRDDTGTLSPRRVKRLAETRRRADAPSLFDETGVAGVYLNEIGPAQAHSLAAAFGVWLLDQRSAAEEPPVVLMAGDGRPITPELLAAVSDGLRWAGCHVIDIGPASAPCTAMAVAQLDAAGGILVGNPRGHAHTTGMKLWSQGARPLSAGGELDAIRQLFESGIDRPTRCSGMLRRYQAEDNYLARLEPFYHALRPLRFVLDTPCPPLPRYVEQLLRPVACQAIPRHETPDRLAEQVRAEGADFAATLDDDGQRCRLLDHSGRPVAMERLIPLLAECLLKWSSADESAPSALPPSVGPGSRRRRTTARADFLVVLETATPDSVIRAIRVLGGRAVTSDPGSAEMERAMRQHDALLGGGPSGRFWYRASQKHFAADALVTLTLLLRLLSQSDRPLCEVLDSRDAPD